MNMVIQKLVGNQCEWSTLKISKAGKNLYCKGKILEKLFPLKYRPTTTIISNNTSDFQILSLFSVIYNEEKI